MAESVVVFRGGSRDGETTVLAEGVRRVFATSDAPGLVDVYEETDETTDLPDKGESAVVYTFAGQEPAPMVTTADSIHLHMPPRR